MEGKEIQQQILKRCWPDKKKTGQLFQTVIVKKMRKRGRERGREREENFQQKKKFSI